MRKKYAGLNCGHNTSASYNFDSSITTEFHVIGRRFYTYLIAYIGDYAQSIYVNLI